MQITIDTVELTGTKPEEGPDDLLGVPDQQIQESLGIGADSVTLKLRDNRKTTLTFTVRRVRDSAEDAAFFLADHATNFPVQGTLVWRTEAGERYLPGAVAVLTQYTQKGATTVHSYRVVGGAWQKTAQTS